MNPIPPSSSSDDLLARAEAALRRTPVPEGPSEEIVARTLATLQASSESETAPFPKRRRLPATLKIAAAVLAAAGSLYCYAVARPAVAMAALAEVAQNLRDPRTLVYRETMQVAAVKGLLNTPLLVKEPSSPPSAFHLFTGVGIIAVAVASVLLWKRGRAISWVAFGLGALACVIGVALEVGWALPANRLIRQGLYATLPAWAAGPMFWLYIGLLAGIFQCGITLLLVKRTRLKTAEWDEAVAFGIGLGAIEAFLVGLVSVIGILAAIVFWKQLPSVVRMGLAESVELGLAAIPLPVVERVSSIMIHVSSCVMIVFGVRAGTRRWFWLAFGYNTAVDAFAAWTILDTPMLKSVAGLAAVEAVVAAFAVFGLAVLAYLRRRFPSFYGLRVGWYLMKQADLRSGPEAS